MERQIRGCHLKRKGIERETRVAGTNLLPAVLLLSCPILWMGRYRFGDCCCGYFLNYRHRHTHTCIYACLYP